MKGDETMQYFSPWTIQASGNLRKLIAEAVEDGLVKVDENVWRGDAGDIVVAKSASDLDSEDYEDFIDTGSVASYLDPPEFPFGEFDNGAHWRGE